MTEKEIQLCEYSLKPGYIFLSRDPVIISSVLGSCVAVSMWDSTLMWAGMAHYLYPGTDQQTAPTARYGTAAVPYLAEMLRREGTKRAHLQAQIFGGASISKEGLQVAQGNIAVAREVLCRLEIKIVSEDVGGDMGRKLIYNTFSNEAIVYKAKQLRKGDWYPYYHARRGA
jgi:chemotaxis protein CheD